MSRWDVFYRLCHWSFRCVAELRYRTLHVMQSWVCCCRCHAQCGLTGSKHRLLLANSDTVICRTLLAFVFRRSVYYC